MSSILKKITDKNVLKRFIRFGLVGLSGVLVNNGLLYILAEFSVLPFYFCSFIAIEVSIITNFLLNDNWTWKGEKSSPFFARLIRYNSSAAFSSIFINMTVLLFLKEWLAVPYLLANLVGIALGMVSNFIINSLWTFGDKRITLPREVKIILLISLAFRLILGSLLGAGFDEAYYFSYALRPALSYFDHPPFVSFLAGFFPKLTGIESAFTIRLGAILFFTLTSLLFYRLALQLIDKKSAIMAFALFNITPLFFLGVGMMILPDAGLAFFWIATVYILYFIFFKNAHPIFWIFAAVATGFAMLSKYHGAILGFSLILYLLRFKPKLYLKPWPYLYGILAFIVFSPVLIWNAQHDWVSFLFQGARASSNTISFVKFGQAVGGQAVYLTPLVFIPLIVVIWRTIKHGLIKGEPKYAFYFFFGTVPVLIFNLIALFQSILPHWTMPGYIVLMVPFGEMIKQANEKRTYITKVIWASTGVIVLLLLAAFLHTNYGIFRLDKLAEKGTIRYKDFYKDATLDALGWDKVNDYLHENNISPDSTFLFTYKWFLSGEVELATKGDYDVMCFNPKDSRGYGIWDAQLDMVGKDGLFISTNRYNYSPVTKYADYFESISDPDTLVVSRGGVPSKWIYFYKCQNLLKKYPVPY